MRIRRGANLIQTLLDYCFGKVDFSAESFEKNCQYREVSPGLRTNFCYLITSLSADVVHDLKLRIAPLVQAENFLVQLHQPLFLF